MHVGLYSPAWPPGRHPNGIVTYTAELKHGLEALGHRVTVVTPPAATRRRRWSPLRLWDRAMSWKPDDPATFPAGGRRLARAVARLHRADRFAVFEMEETFGWSAAVRRRIDAPVVTRLHGPHFLGKDGHEDAAASRRSARREAAEGAAIAAADGVTSPSPSLLADTLAHYRLRRDGQAIFNPVRAVPDEACWTLAGSDPALILCVGRFDWRKGADVVLQAFARVVQTRPDARLAFAGPDHGLQLTPGALLHFADYCGAHLTPEVAARIDFLGTQPPERVAALRRAARVTVCGSRFETFGYAVAEGMALGCPLVGPRIYGVRELIVDGVSGWLVPPEDPPAMAGALIAALADPAACARRGAEALARCRAILDPLAVADQTARYYAELVARSGAPADAG